MEYKCPWEFHLTCSIAYDKDILNKVPMFMMLLEYYGVIERKRSMILDVELMDWFYNDTA